MQSHRLTFTNSAGEQLSARLDMPLDNQPQAYALFAHCFTCSKDLKAVGNISLALTQDGIAVFRFDFTGLGESDGDFADTNLSSNVDDLLAAADFLGEQYQAPQLLIGHSLGGAAVLQAAAHIASARAVVTIGAPAEPTHVSRLLSRDQETINTQGVAEVTLAGRRFTIKKQFLDDLSQTRMQDTIRNLRKALLILHAPLDNVVGIDNARQLFEAALHPKSFISLDQADHLLSDQTDSLYAGSIIAAWVKNYIEPVQPNPLQAETADEWVVVHTGQTPYRTAIVAGGHRLVADEPLEAGGADTGPNPYDYLVAALGTCTSITLRMYADRHGWPLEAIQVRLKHEKIHARDCETCETESGKVDWIEREIELVGSLTSEQRARLGEIADKCPVHRTLHSEVVVNTELKS
ncbi:MAG: alpha/beta fold hydrolase [Candidatus Tectomicrobia bacterium]|nr:alpha/beta fold hydrolase [Candidatus Tectomicrobia bacterium]